MQEAAKTRKVFKSRLLHFFVSCKELHGNAKFRCSFRDILAGYPFTLDRSGDDWDSNTGRVYATDKRSATINKNLDVILRKANDAFDGLRFSEEAFSIDELVDRIKGKEATPTLLIDFLEQGNQRMLKRVGVEITKATHYKFRNGSNYILLNNSAAIAY